MSCKFGFSSVPIKCDNVIIKCCLGVYADTSAARNAPFPKINGKTQIFSFLECQLYTLNISEVVQSFWDRERENCSSLCVSNLGKSAIWSGWVGGRGADQRRHQILVPGSALPLTDAPNCWLSRQSLFLVTFVNRNVRREIFDSLSLGRFLKLRLKMDPWQLGNLD